MSCQTPQCKEIRSLVSQLCPQRSEPLCTVLDLGGPGNVQVNIQWRENEVRSLTLVGLASEGTLPFDVCAVLAAFVKNPMTLRYDCTSKSYLQ